MFLSCAFRSPLERIDQRTFNIHFQNLQWAYGRKSTWLCFEVETNKDSNSPVPLCSGVFQNQVSSTLQPHPGQELSQLRIPYHTELCFLTWFQQRMSPDQDYQVTWYVSWSPCANCAQQVADFLSKYPKVSLTILTARLYYFWVPDCRQGFLRMDQKGARVRIMYYEEFEHCWAKFVYNHGKPWVANNNKLKKNYQFLVTKLEEILRDPIERISPKIFYYQFNNTTSLRDRTSSWLCFTVKTNKDSNSPASFLCGVFRNQAPPKTPCHAENCFLTWFNDLLSSDQDYQVTWYASWSPCADCAELVADFLATQRNVSLTIFAARLYYHREPEIQRGLRRMHQKGAQLHIMSLPEFQHCWENFVHNQGKQFQPWDGLNENHQLLDTQLQEILR
uniref:single-stranded DNA cytosine deaminase n=1 Tax=Prolemur simus TaxID=1328070 RepID=A0A8C8YN93_PROSS